MKYQVIIKPAAEADIDTVCKWYERQRPGLGDDFLLCVEELVETIGRSPKAFPLAGDNSDVRVSMTKRFPYSVFFVLERESVYVLGVFHGRRDPETWKERLE